MAFFRKDKPAQADEQTPVETATTDEPVEEDASESPEEAVPHVGISVSTYGQPKVTQTPRPPAEAPAQPSASATLPENTPVRHALAALPEKPEPRDILNVMRQSLQGHLYLRVNGDARKLLAEKQQLTLAVSTVGENRFLLAFTGQDAIQASVTADGNQQTSAIGQPAVAVLQNVIAGPYQGLVLDHATDGPKIVLPRQLIEKTLQEGAEVLAVKEALSKPRSESSPRDVATALAQAGGWVAVRGEGEKAGITEIRTGEGVRRIEVFSHPLEVLALGRSDRPARITAKSLGKALRTDEGLTGIVVNPAGPWIEIDRADLEPLFEAADAPEPENVDEAAGESSADADED